MPRLDNMETHTFGNFGFSGIGVDHLGASEYTLVTALVDITGSVVPFTKELEAMLTTAIDACRKSPRSDNLLVRVALFNSGAGIREIHGFKPLADIDVNAYGGSINAGGSTNLYDACYSGVGMMNTYAKKLADMDFLVNAITFIITDGDDNASSSTPAMVKDELERTVTDELVESHVSVLIGINAVRYLSELEDFRREAGLTQFIDAGDVDKGKLAKLAQFVSQSISSQSQSLGTGGPSQNISATI